MKTELVRTLTATFEAHAQQTDGGIEYWLARDLQYMLGYDEWRNFNSAISKGKTACELSGHRVGDHFVGVNKMVDLGSGSQRQIEDIMLTRYACYLIAQNGDSRKPEIAFAQTYFAIQTRRAELIEQRMLEAERISARRKLSATEKELSQVIYEQTGGNEDFALIRSKGDQALFGKTTQAMKARWKVPDHRAGRLRANHHLEGQGFRYRDHHLQRPRTRVDEWVHHFQRAHHQQSSRAEDPARTRHSPGEPARRRGCEEDRAPPDFGREEIPRESRRLGIGGLSVPTNDSKLTRPDELGPVGRAPFPGTSGPSFGLDGRSSPRYLRAVRAFIL
jgi:hypothetical protein